MPAARGRQVSARLLPSERVIIATLAAGAFVNVLDFMMVTPLGPDLAVGLGIPVDRLGAIGGAYTAAGFVAGLAGSTFFDRFDRRTALAAAYAGLAAGTLAGAFAWDLPSMLAARILAGMFGGPATALTNAIVADVVPAERRGRAMGVVMGAFSVASVAGVPLSLELAHRGDWRWPFYAVGAACLAIALLGRSVLPTMRAHLGGPPGAPIAVIVRRPEVQGSVALAAALFGSGFMILPNFPTFVLVNLGYPRDRFGLLYGVGGGLTFFALRLYGRLIDRFGAAPVATVASLSLITVTALWFGLERTTLPVMLLFVWFMLSMSARNVSFNTLVSKVPAADERARYLSLQSAAQHLFSSFGAFSSLWFIHEGPGGRVEGMPTLALGAMMLMACAPPLFWFVEGRLRRRGA